MNDNKRNIIQKKAFKAWDDAGKVGTVEIATGVGKTFIALHALHSMPKDDDKVHFYLAETVNREKDLNESIKKYDEIYGCNTKLEYNLEFHCYQSVYGKYFKNLGLVIADEIHDALTPIYSAFFGTHQNIYSGVIGLSAKIDLDTEYEVEHGVIKIKYHKRDYLKRYCPIVFKYDLNNSYNDSLSRKLKVHVIRHKLDDKNKTIVAGSKTKKFKQTEKEFYDYWTNRYNKSYTIKDANRRELEKTICMSKRNNLLYNLPSKVNPCKLLLQRIKRTIIFGNSIDFLQKVTPYVVTSRISESKNKYYIDLFEKKTIDEIASFKKLKQGANLSGLDNVVLTSYYSKEKDLIQRFGRVRNSNEIGNAFIFVTAATQEQLWFNEMMKNINVYKIIIHNDIKECIDYLSK